MPSVNNVAAYMNQGGRVFAEHFHYYWMRSGPAELRGTATYAGSLQDPPTPSTAMVDTTHAKGAVLADWLVLTGASTQRGQFPVALGQHSVTAVTAPTQRWIYLPQNPNDMAMRESVQYMTFNTPLAAEPANQCGRVVFTDIHIGASLDDPAGGAALGGDITRSGATGTGTPFPEGCVATGMSPQAKALEFMFFDLSACVTPPDVPPVPPPPGVPPPANTPPPPPPPPPPPAK
jgi:hypothetical protein